MKALVLSDSHGSFTSIMRAVEKEKNIDMIIHAGDIHRDVEDIMMAWQNIPCAYVVGNNDFYVRNEPKERSFIFGGKRIFLTHGHLFGVKQSLYGLKKAAKENNADICIFGHTHSRLLERDGNMWMLNPGSAVKSYGIIEINNGEINITLKEN